MANACEDNTSVPMSHFCHGSHFCYFLLLLPLQTCWRGSELLKDHAVHRFQRRPWPQHASTSPMPDHPPLHCILRLRYPHQVACGDQQLSPFRCSSGGTPPPARALAHAYGQGLCCPPGVHSSAPDSQCPSVIVCSLSSGGAGGIKLVRSKGF